MPVISAEPPIVPAAEKVLAPFASALFVTTYLIVMRLPSTRALPTTPSPK